MDLVPEYSNYLASIETRGESRNLTFTPCEFEVGISEQLIDPVPEDSREILPVFLPKFKTVILFFEQEETLHVSFSSEEFGSHEVDLEVKVDSAEQLSADILKREAECFFFIKTAAKLLFYKISADQQLVQVNQTFRSDFEYLGSDKENFFFSVGEKFKDVFVFSSSTGKKEKINFSTKMEHFIGISDGFLFYLDEKEQLIKYKQTVSTGFKLAAPLNTEDCYVYTTNESKLLCSTKNHIDFYSFKKDFLDLRDSITFSSEIDSVSMGEKHCLVVTKDRKASVVLFDEDGMPEQVFSGELGEKLVEATNLTCRFDKENLLGLCFYTLDENGISFSEVEMNVLDSRMIPVKKVLKINMQSKPFIPAKYDSGKREIENLVSSTVNSSLLAEMTAMVDRKMKDFSNNINDSLSKHFEKFAAHDKKQKQIISKIIATQEKLIEAVNAVNKGESPVPLNEEQKKKIVSRLLR